MLDGLLRIRESSNSKIPEQIWVLITQMTNALKPFFDLNTKMQAIHYTVGDLIRDICDCVGVLKTLSDPVALSLLKAIRQRQKLISENLHIAAAIYMDPRLTNKLRSYEKSENCSDQLPCGHPRSHPDIEAAHRARETTTADR